MCKKVKSDQDVISEGIDQSLRKEKKTAHRIKLLLLGKVAVIGSEIVVVSQITVTFVNVSIDIFESYIVIRSLV
jgi:hypothetical protein